MAVAGAATDRATPIAQRVPAVEPESLVLAAAATQGAGASAAPPAAAVSLARNPREYRRDGAQHIYRKLPDRIFVGRLPRLLFAVGVINIEIDARGAVAAIQWPRAPVHMGGVTYTETWLWDKSGRFQLDTLTQGQD